MTYELEYVVQDGIANQLTWSVTLPLGMEITTLPGYCLTAGSSLIPQTAGSRSCHLRRRRFRS
ncbi:hypothetical protein G7066_02890 [Leucobacter coleopterorum]|uniref:Uncharacterized protein n=1 Tax=Leucobacter coleopterorum TaxID=2714933 RepID=A0ABX6JYG9_9MICO|nr:hypothetical protein [Leucobacter coleopterorum]QIM17894.1 hypothetical protein G7066_02890 [Leucobacter coleopterorum]